MSTIFTKIIEGKIPSFKIMENEYVYSFLDIRPIHLGHTLIVPKLEIDYFLDCPEPYYTEVFRAAKSIGKAIQKATACKRIGSAIIGLEVPHFHLHLVPMNSIGDLNFSHAKEVSQEELAKMHRKISACL